MVSLSFEGHGHLQLDGKGEAVDSLIKMRRLPAALMLDHALTAETASEETLRPVIVLVAAFYQACAPLAMAPAAYRRRLATVTAKNCISLAAPAYLLQTKMLDRIFGSLHLFLQTQSRTLDERVRGGHIIEGQSDLRAEHVFLEHLRAVIDCLKFSRKLCTADSADEVADYDNWH